MGKEALAESVRSGESPFPKGTGGIFLQLHSHGAVPDPTPHIPISPSPGALREGRQRHGQPGESRCAPAQPVPCSDSRELPRRTLLAALPGDTGAGMRLPSPAPG